MTTFSEFPNLQDLQGLTNEPYTPDKIESMVCMYFGITKEQYADRGFRNSIHHIEKGVIYPKPMPESALKFVKHNREKSVSDEWVLRTLRDAYDVLIADLNEGETLYLHCTRTHSGGEPYNLRFKDYTYFAKKDVPVTWGEMLDKAKREFERINIK